ncbi:uncharacterized protein SPPG_08333 [Spizellomyces punctatus DAOM BR117]|uniref:Cyclin N-terminal domain-containing protein n=1 Tax=Spizellomyces punctatus (strain DAOM BR117) TaxID=645134 RepID=A0A0L0H642_SPIPD|nr:uncharacterized protein SPPG_08333 [Spizellomyces punctatus DAOM BR117]KNC96178.1 hypothetical protein SPPG_08333 [Spizellomyces punctatus DAOM BR117]|eukprot:XP_016604218.1 hypothetical protein SPPG_08333 [Spizellomyces punctatus DAOM BR117]
MLPSLSMVDTCSLSSAFDSLFACSTSTMPDTSTLDAALAFSTVDDSVLSQHVELTSFVVLLLWNRIPLDVLLQIWSTPDIGGHVKFRNFVQGLLSATKVSSSVVVLALKYLQRIARSRHTLDKDSHLLGENSAQIALLVSLVLANKFADDERFTNSAWATVANVPIETLNTAELEALFAINFNLQVNEVEYTAWITRLSHFASEAASAYERQELKKQQALSHHCYLPSPVSPPPISQDYYPRAAESSVPRSARAYPTPLSTITPQPPPSSATTPHSFGSQWAPTVSTYGWQDTLFKGSMHGGQMVMGH